MDKQMIEEMAIEIAKRDCYLYDKFPKEPKHNCVSQDPEIMLESSKNYITIATWLVKAGYRKIPENAVVLTETEYNDLLSDEVKTIERDIAEYWATEEVATVAKELHKEGYRKIDDHAILVLRKAKCLEQKIRKETAEKFAERVKMAFYYEFDELIPSIMADKIDEICKEITDKEVQNGN